jgi:hypothetical protein
MRIGSGAYIGDSPEQGRREVTLEVTGTRFNREVTLEVTGTRFNREVTPEVTGARFSWMLLRSTEGVWAACQRPSSSIPLVHPQW